MAAEGTRMTVPMSPNGSRADPYKVRFVPDGGHCEYQLKHSGQYLKSIGDGNGTIVEQSSTITRRARWFLIPQTESKPGVPLSSRPHLNQVPNPQPRFSGGIRLVTGFRGNPEKFSAINL